MWSHLISHCAVIKHQKETKCLTDLYLFALINCTASRAALPSACLCKWTRQEHVNLTKISANKQRVGNLMDHQVNWQITTRMQRLYKAKFILHHLHHRIMVHGMEILVSVICGYMASCRCEIGTMATSRIKVKNLFSHSTIISLNIHVAMKQT